MERNMKRIVILALLLWAGLASAVEFGNNPGGTPVSVDNISFNQLALTGDSRSGWTYVAASGDVLDSIYVWVAPNNTTDSIFLGLYTIVANQPTARVFACTLITTSTGLAQWGKNVNFSMTDGVEYCLSWTADEEFMAVGYNAGATGDAEEDLTPPPPWPATWTAGTDRANQYFIYGVVTTGTVDTCSVTHSLTGVDTTATTIDVRNDYTWTAGVLDSMSLIWDDDTAPAGPLGRASVTSSFTDPDTLTATGLSGCGTYYLWWIHWPVGCNPDTSAMLTIPTTCTATRRTLIGS